jgi:hypothetical protein
VCAHTLEQTDRISRTKPDSGKERQGGHSSNEEVAKLYLTGDESPEKKYLGAFLSRIYHDHKYAVEYGVIRVSSEINFLRFNIRSANR